MKILIIKIGKAWNTIKRDGLIKGGKRVLGSFVAMFRIVGKGDILFVTGGVGDSALYRSHHVAEELEENGFKCSITVQDNPLLGSYTDKFKVFIFHRVLFTPTVEKMIKEIKRQGKEIIFETDDLVYDPQYLKHMDYYQKMNKFERKLYENGVGGEILNDEYVKVCTTTTNFLADKLKERNKEVFIVPNKLSKEDVEIADAIAGKRLTGERKIVQENRKGKEEFPISNFDSPEQVSYFNSTNFNKKTRLGYFSGTISHNKDFATITDALMHVMEKHKSVELFLVGPLDVENKLIEKFRNRIVQLPYAPRKKHFENIAKVDINLAPLELENPFCQSKSELKFFEAGIVGVPTVAVANRTFSEAIEDGVDGFLATETQEWIKKIEMLIIDRKMREDMGKKAREKALGKYTTKNATNAEYYKYLRSKIC